MYFNLGKNATSFNVKTILLLSQATDMLKLELWIVKAKTLELIAPEVGYNVLGSLVWGCLAHWELLELRVKVLSFSRIRLEFCLN